MSPFLGLSLHEKRKGLCLIRTFGPSSRNAQVQAAQSACGHLLPGSGRQPNQAQLQQERAQGLAFSRCVRAHGVPRFPDPDSTGRIPEQWPGVDQGSPKFEAANHACSRYRPPYMPSNAAYNAYAGDKEIREYPFNDHEGGQGFHDVEKLRFLAERLAG